MSRTAVDQRLTPDACACPPQPFFFTGENRPQDFESKLEHIFLPTLDNPEGLDGRVPDLIIFERYACPQRGSLRPTADLLTRLLPSASLGTSSSSPISLAATATSATRADRSTRSSSSGSAAAKSRC